MPTSKAKLLHRQKGKCSYCGLTFKDEDVMEIDHIIPRQAGGDSSYKNLQLLHRHCHDEKTREDLKLITEHQNRKAMEKQFKWTEKWFSNLFYQDNWTWKDDLPVTQEPRNKKEKDYDLTKEEWDNISEEIPKRMKEYASSNNIRWLNFIPPSGIRKKTR